MDDAIVIAPAKKRMTETDYQKCVCYMSRELVTETLVAETLVDLSRERHKYGDTALVFKQIIVTDRFQKAAQHKKPSLSQNKIGRPLLGTIPSPVNESDTPPISSEMVV